MSLLKINLQASGESFIKTVKALVNEATDLTLKDTAGQCFLAYVISFHDQAVRNGNMHTYT